MQRKPNTGIEVLSGHQKVAIPDKFAVARNHNQSYSSRNGRPYIGVDNQGSIHYAAVGDATA